MVRHGLSQKEYSANRKIAILLSLIMIIAGGIIARLFLIQAVHGGSYNLLARKQQQILQELVPKRGEILARDKYKSASLMAAGAADRQRAGGLRPDNCQVVATSKSYQLLYAVPKEIKDGAERAEIASGLSSALGVSPGLIMEKLSKTDDPYEPIAHKLVDDQAAKIKNLNLRGIYFVSENWRFYPAGNFLSHVIGFVGFAGDKQVGRYGLEGYYQKKLSGEPGLLEAAKDAVGRFIFASDYNLEPARDGRSLLLTIDRNIQFEVESELKAVVEKWKGEAGAAIVMEPQTGKILAMANVPDFDPNNYSKVKNEDIFRNAAVEKLYEPGSVMKPLTMSAGIDTGKVEPDTVYTDTGSVQIGGYTITNAAKKSYGLSTMTKVLEKSINTGAIFVQRKIGPDVFRDYVKKFGLGEKTGIDLGGEVGGNLGGLKRGGPEINFATAAFGQGIAITPIELITALGAIANRGKLMKPYLVDKIIDADGNETETQPMMVRQVISPDTALKVTSMLVSTVNNGYDKIKLSGYDVAGKTGTAQIPDPKTGGYLDSSETIHTFVGWAPASNPKFIILLKMDKPKGIDFASNSLASSFANITRYLLNYYEIPPRE
ncbi:MAG: penicillin-binding protein 2 [Candidatus Portnoybacteria bacterium]|nr:penicillin-binding protein 2 [Candidatus Portnoybacteria bacterium]